MRHYLMMRLYGAMAAWGDVAVGEFRPSHPHPTRSAVLGLIAGALGIRRDQEQALLDLDRSCRLAIRLDADGEVLRDFHTAQVPPSQRKVVHRTRQDELNAAKLNTILSSRDYRCDSAASVALSLCSNTPPYSLQQIAEALRQPHFVPYLGRKACPLALPLDPQLCEAPSIDEAFSNYPTAQQQLQQLNQGLPGFGQLPPQTDQRLFWEDGEQAAEAELHYPRRDRLRSRRGWQYDERREYSRTMQQEA